MKPAKLAKLLKRHLPEVKIEHGMYVDSAYRRWRNTPRKWISITTWSGQNFVVEDK